MGRLATALSAASPGWTAVVPVQPDRDLARSWANQELARPEYRSARPGLIERVVDWIWRQITDVGFAGGTSQLVGLLIVAVVIAAVAGFLIYRAGGLHRMARRQADPVLPSRHSTAAEHRALADRHAAAQNWDLAVVERFRAIARELEERALLTPQPGRTARELARDGGAAVPEQANDLLVAARYFDDVSYGHLRVGPDADLAVRELDDRLRTARPVSVH
jgi:Domain of unknown function (DUF4129)